MNTELHKQKVEILSRLVKDNSLTLEEALLLLREDEQVIVNQPVIQPFTGTSIPPYPLPGTYYSTMVGHSGISCTNVEGSTWNSDTTHTSNENTLTL